MNQNRELKDIIKRFSLIDGVWGEIYGEDLFEYRLNDNRVYFFYTGEDLTIEKSLKEVESILERVVYIPQETYVVFINSDEKVTIKDIIQIEENEFFFKKYVLQFTSMELKIYKENAERIAFGKNIWKKESFGQLPEDLKQFLLRIAIKVPVIKLELEPIELRGIESRVLDLLQLKDNNAEWLSFHNQMLNQLKLNTPEKYAEQLFFEVMEDL